MKKTVKFAVIGDCHYSEKESYGGRDCAGAKNRLAETIERLNEKELDFVFSLGDLGDGGYDYEAPEILNVLKKSKHPVKIAVGNHDLVRRSVAEHMELVGMPAPAYDFSVGDFRFIVFDPFEISRFSRDENDRKRYWDFRKNNADVPVQEWPGLLSESTWEWLEKTLDKAKAEGENVILLCHVPVLHLACIRPEGETEPPARIVEHEKMLSLLDRYGNVRAYIAGHYHNGGLAVRNGVVHKTVRSVCDFPLATACTVTVDDKGIKIEGIGAESNFMYLYQ